MLSSHSLVGAQQRPVITVTVQGDHVEYNHEAQTLAVHGDVAITAQSDQPGRPTVAIASGEVEADLANGLIIAHQGVRLLSQQLAMRGERLDLRFAQDEFTLTQGAVSVEALHLRFPGIPVRGYFFGDTIYKEADIIYVIEGRVTTCDRTRPHYSVGVRQLTYDTRTGRFTIRDGRLSLYGRTITIPGFYSGMMRGNGKGDTKRWLAPGHSSYDGLYFPFGWDLSPEDGSWEVSAVVRLGTRGRLPAEIRAERDTGRDLFTVRVAHRETTPWNIRETSRVTYLPEVAYQRRLLLPEQDDRAANLDLSLGYVREEPDHGPFTAAVTGRLALDYTPMATARQRRDGAWWAAGVEQNFYDTGQRLRDLQLELGLGSTYQRLLKGALWYVRHQTAGSTPFMYDDVYANNELHGLAGLPLGKRWALDAYGRLDLDDTRLRELEVGLSRRSHCLTWGLRWDKAAENISLLISINGLTNDAPPYRSRPVVEAEEVPPLPAPLPGPAGDNLLRLPISDD